MAENGLPKLCFCSNLAVVLVKKDRRTRNRTGLAFIPVPSQAEESRVTGQPERKWVLYTTASGTPVVSQEIHKELQGKPPVRELGQLMWRIQQGTTLPRDTKHLGDGLLEARLTYQSNEYRLYYAQGVKGEHVLLGLKFHQKKGSASQDRAIEVARERLGDWRSRI